MSWEIPIVIKVYFSVFFFFSKILTLTKKVVGMIQDKRLATQRRLGIVMETEGWERALGRQALLVKAKMKN